LSAFNTQADFHAAYRQLAELINAKDFCASPVPRMRLVSRHPGSISVDSTP
jgi:hypothetical protein